MRSRRPWGRCKQAGVCAAPRPRAMRIRWRRGSFGDRLGAAVAEQPREAATGEAGTGPGGAKNLGVPRAPWHVPYGGGQALRCGEQIRKACRFGEGWPGDLRAISY
ncbi:hypothetical protein ACRRTK_014222 [Alexandromys fortis]